MGYGADIIGESGRKLLTGIPKIQDPIIQLLPTMQAAVGDVTSEEFQNLANTLSPGFFTQKSAECLPLIAECTKALSKLPPVVPSTAALQRTWFSDMQSKLQKLQSNTFPGMEQNVLIVYNPLTEPAAKLTNLTAIISKLPAILADFVIMRNDMRKLKKALRI